MTAFLFLQRFENGIVVAMPFQPLMDILSRFGKLGRGRGDLEITLPPDTAAVGCTVIGSSESGVTCIGFERPRWDDALRDVTWECIAKFGCCAFDDTLDTVYAPLNSAAALPAKLADACLNEVHRAGSAQQLWPQGLEWSLEGSGRPVLRYDNANPAGPNYQFFDYGDLQKKELYIEMGIAEDACNAGTLRVLRNLELRVDRAISANSEFSVFYRYADAKANLLVMESPKLGELANHVTFISPMFGDGERKAHFVADREVFASMLSRSAQLTQQLHESDGVRLDASVSSVTGLARFLDGQHTLYCQERDAHKTAQTFASSSAAEWAFKAGAYLGTVVRLQIGGQWGYVTRGQQRRPAVRLHTGRVCHPHVEALSHIINGRRHSIALWFHELTKNHVSATPRKEDLACNIPGYCQILAGKSSFTSGGLPLESEIPRDKLDFGVGSLDFLDQYFAVVARERDRLDRESLSNLVLAAGAYIGEVVRSNMADSSSWLWVNYDDFARKNPDFPKHRPRELGFMAFLDSKDNTAYPLAHVAAVLDGADITSTLEFAKQLVGKPPVSVTQPDTSASELGTIDIKQCVAELPANERSYFQIQPPPWIAGDDLEKLFGHYATLLEEGRVVWAHIIQVNEALFEHGDKGHPGEIVYDPSGALSLGELAPVAEALFALKGQSATLNASDPEQSPLRRIADYLENERIRVFGIPVPVQISKHQLLISTIFFERAHLPDRKLSLSCFPVLISNRCPGAAMVLPSRWWPADFIALWQQLEEQRRYARWLEHWQKLAEGRDAEAEDYFQNRLKALSSYAREGMSAQRMEDFRTWRMRDFSPDTSPPPFEWEWDLDSELRSYAEGVLREVESERACGLPFNAARARNAYAAQYTAQTIALHRLILFSERMCSSENIKICPDDIQYVALGAVAGCEEHALRAAHMLCAAWKQADFYERFIRPEVRFIFMLFSAYLNQPIPPLAPFQKTPKLDALLDNECWRKADAEILAPLCLAACQEHTVLAPHGPFEGLPIGILLVFKLRAMGGLANPTVDHPLLAVPAFPFPSGVPLEAACDEWVASVRERMVRHGYVEGSIHEALVNSTRLTVKADFRVATRGKPARREKGAEGLDLQMAMKQLVGITIYSVLTFICAKFFLSTEILVIRILFAIAAVGLGLMAGAYAIGLVWGLLSHRKDE